MTTRQLHPYVEWVFAVDPILASTSGDLGGAERLGDIDPYALAEQQERRRKWLSEAEQVELPASGTLALLEHRVLLTELRTAVRRTEFERVPERAPYWYTERLGDALSVLMSKPVNVEHAEALLVRLRSVPEYLAQAQRNLGSDSPPLWAQMGAAGARGLERFLGQAVVTHAGPLPERLAREIVRTATTAAGAAGEFAGFVDGLTGRAEGEWACGTEQFDFLLQNFHHLEMDAVALSELGRELVDRERATLERLAGENDRDTPWQQQIDQIKDWHPEPADFLNTYRDAMQRNLEHTRNAELVSIPDGAVCEMGWVPEYRGEGLPLGVMSPSPPYAPGLRSDFLITPGDPDASAEQRRQHMRDNSFAFATSIAGHETYPGHHVQYVHHKLGTPRDSIRRYFSTPQFVEGWGLYVEDLLEETGFLADPRLRLVKQRNALWRALRILVDVGLHTGTMTIAEATELMRMEAGMDEHMASGEVRRYTRHDNPTYPSSYTVGKQLMQDLRVEHERRTPGSFSLRGFHDWLLSFGSPPLALLADIET